MEWYYYVLIAAFVICFLIYQGIKTGKNAKRRTIDRIRKSFGKESEREYTYNEYNRIRSFFDSMQHVHEIDDITWNDLGLDDIYIRQLNNTASSCGEECLYNILREPQFDDEVLKKRDRIAEYLENNREEAYMLEYEYAKMGRSKSIAVYDFITRLYDVKIKSKSVHYLNLLLLLAAIVMFVLDTAIGILCVVLALIINVTMYYALKSDTQNYFICFKYICNMANVAKNISALEFKNEAGASRDSYEEIKAATEHIGNVYKKIKPVLRGASFMQSGSISGSFVDIFLEYIKVITHADLIIFANMVDNVKKYSKDFMDLYESLGNLEAMYAIASYRTLLREGEGKLGFCVPVFKEGKTIDMKNGYHSLLSEPVANDINAKCGVLITGSNASGKSTFLKTVAINLLFAQTLYTCAASEFMTFHTDILSSMTLRDDIEGGDSYYMVEIKALKRIVDFVKKKAKIVAFVDEVLRGTNTVERIAASSEILRSLNTDNSICFAATHDIELTAILENEYDNYHFKEEIKENDIMFDYRICMGRATTRNAIKLLAIIGYESGIIEKAEGLAERYAKTGSWTE